MGSFKLDTKNDINRGKVKVTSSGDTDRGEIGVGLPGVTKQMNPLSNPGGNAIEGEMPHKNTLLKKKSEKESTTIDAAQSKYFHFHHILTIYFSNLEKNPFTARRSTAGQAGLIDKPSDSFQNNDEEESDDYDEFYKDRSFLNTGMAAKQYEQ